MKGVKMTKIVMLKNGVYGLNAKPSMYYDDRIFAFNGEITIVDEEAVAILKGVLAVSELPETLYLLCPYGTNQLFISIEEPTPIPNYVGDFNYGTSACITLPEKQFKYILIGAEND